MWAAVQGNSRKEGHTLAGVLCSPLVFLEVIIMDVQVIGQLIATLGFPIVACCAMFWMVNKNEERHREEIGDLRKTIEDNTSVLASLKELIQIIVNRES